MAHSRGMPHYNTSYFAPTPSPQDFEFPVFHPSTQHKTFEGDNDDLPHQILWNKSIYLESLGEPVYWPDTETVIVGGGVSGLVLANAIESQDFVLLDQSPQMGGNSKAHQTNRSASSLGAAYITIPEKGSQIYDFLKGFNLDQSGRIETTSPVFRQGKVFEDFKSTLPMVERKVFDSIIGEFERIYTQDYPEIPPQFANEISPSTLALDKIPFSSWLGGKFGEIPISLKEYFQMYSWSSFNGSIDEISAAQYLNFSSAETQGVWAFSGGNAAITQAIVKKLSTSGGIYNRSIVADIEKTEGGFRTTFVRDGKSIKINSKNLVFASPKFLLKKILADQSSFKSILEAASHLEYRPYVVAQIQLKSSLQLPGFDHFIIKESFQPNPFPLEPLDRSFTDFINTNWALGHNNTKAITVYKPYPITGAQQFLFHPNAFEKISSQILEELESMGIDSTSIENIGLTRWGHAMPIAKPELLSKNQLRALYDPSCSRVPGLALAGQDIWANPSFECAFSTAMAAKTHLEI